MQTSAKYEVVIVGGRPAGATLAARLGARGVRVLVVDRAKFPSSPGVPSSPVLYPSGLRLLDELGLDEAQYASADARMRHVTFSFDPWWATTMPLASTHGRDYALGIERPQFDRTLWEHLARFPSVERREGFSVLELLRDASGRVVGLVGAAAGGPEERIEAGCVIGADGRYSTVARLAGAPFVEERNEHVSTVYFATWEGVAATEDGFRGAHVCTNGRGLNVLFFAAPGGAFTVCTHARADRADVRGDVQRAYVETVNSLPSAARRLTHARQVSRLSGIKRIGNGYRQAAGAGWALVGDALHMKDPVDGQGIYDALLEGKLLDEALARARAGTPWDEAMTRYADEVRSATRPMFLSTTDRLRRELYDEPPTVVIRTVLRWLMTDPAYQTSFSRYLSRDVAPDRWLTGGLVAGAVMRGLWRDLRGTASPSVAGAVMRGLWRDLRGTARPAPAPG
ncbi:MAG: NAD(P)/FAD-dependent oxidoreductase [Myxococcota bacterium]